MVKAWAAFVAQLVERLLPIQEVRGSSPKIALTSRYKPRIDLDFVNIIR